MSTTQTFQRWDHKGFVLATGNNGDKVNHFKSD